MVTTIQIDEKTKAMLDKIKIHYRQSYNELIINLAKDKMKKKDIMAFAGVWKNTSDEDAESMKEHILELRKRSTRELTGH